MILTGQNRISILEGRVAELEEGFARMSRRSSGSGKTVRGSRCGAMVPASGVRNSGDERVGQDIGARQMSRATTFGSLVGACKSSPVVSPSASS